jgi:hypothetical protein
VDGDRGAEQHQERQPHLRAQVAAEPLRWRGRPAAAPGSGGRCAAVEYASRACRASLHQPRSQSSQTGMFTARRDQLRTAPARTPRHQRRAGARTPGVRTGTFLQNCLGRRRQAPTCPSPGARFAGTFRILLARCRVRPMTRTIPPRCGTLPADRACSGARGAARERRVPARRCPARRPAHEGRAGSPPRQHVRPMISPVRRRRPPQACWCAPRWRQARRWPAPRRSRPTPRWRRRARWPGSRWPSPARSRSGLGANTRLSSTLGRRGDRPRLLRRRCLRAPRGHRRAALPRRRAARGLVRLARGPQPRPPEPALAPGAGRLAGGRAPAAPDSQRARPAPAELAGGHGLGGAARAVRAQARPGSGGGGRGGLAAGAASWHMRCASGRAATRFCSSARPSPGCVCWPRCAAAAEAAGSATGWRSARCSGHTPGRSGCWP